MSDARITNESKVVGQTDRGEDITEDKFVATYEGEKKTFNTFSEANSWLEQFDDSSEPAASEMTPEDAEEINSDVHVGLAQGQRVETPANDNDEPGAGNRQAPHLTKETANDDNDNQVPAEVKAAQKK